MGVIDSAFFLIGMSALLISTGLVFLYLLPAISELKNNERRRYKRN